MLCRDINIGLWKDLILFGKVRGFCWGLRESRGFFGNGLDCGV